MHSPNSQPVLTGTESLFNLSTCNESMRHLFQ
jgi:hypothetical protein